MPYCDDTSIGGPNGTFPNTVSLWSQFMGARTDDQVRRRIVTGRLMEAYWKPVYCYLRRKGYPNEQAKDLVQGFFCEIVLGRDIFQQVDREKGRFRTFLLTALTRYVVDFHRRDGRAKRNPEGGIVQMDFEEVGDWAVPISPETPDEAFHYGWIAELLERVLRELEEEYRGSGRTAHWEVFRARVLAPLLEDTEAPPLSDLCTRYGVPDAMHASNMIVTVKRRFHTVLKRRLMDSAGSETAAEEEFEDIFRFLSNYGAR